MGPDGPHRGHLGGDRRGGREAGARLRGPLSRRVAPVTLDPAAVDLAPWIGRGDGVVVGEGCSEAVGLLDALTPLEGIRLWVGLPFRPVLPGAAGVEVWSFGAAGATRGVPGLRIVPCHFSALPRLFAAWAIPGDVALVQVSPPDGEGRCSLGIGADYLADAASTARTMIAEVNARMPRTRGPALPYEAFAAVLHTDRPLLEAPRVEPTAIDRAIARHVAGVVRDGDTLQLGVGWLPEAVLAALHGHRDLRVHSGFVSDGVLDLLEAGVVSRGVTTAIALGSARLFAACAERDDVVFAPTSVTHAPGVLARIAARGDQRRARGRPRRPGGLRGGRGPGRRRGRGAARLPAGRGRGRRQRDPRAPRGTGGPRALGPRHRPAARRGLGRHGARRPPPAGPGRPGPPRRAVRNRLRPGAGARGARGSGARAAAGGTNCPVSARRSEQRTGRIARGGADAPVEHEPPGP